MTGRIRKHAVYNFWPGFVDVMSNLLIVVLFFLLLFVVSHYFLGRNLDTKNTEIELLNSQLTALSDELSNERKNSADLGRQLSAAQSDYKDSLAKIALMTQDIEALELRKKELEKAVAAHKSAFENERKISDDAKAHIAALNAKTKNLTDEIAKLNAALGAAEEKAKTQNAQIADLGKRLNKALAQKASELSYYRSDFFGTLRKVLENRADIRVEGDRFVFQSELFFKSGSAELEERGKKQLDLMAKSVKELSQKIPAKVSWVLRVDGHTDNLPIHTEKYASNWHLSSDRAIAVVDYLIKKGVPANRLVAAGFGAHQPIAKGDTPAARRKNRRIEFKLTER